MKTMSVSSANAEDSRAARLQAAGRDWMRDTFATVLLRSTVFIIITANQLPLIAWLAYATVLALLLAFPTTAGDGLNALGDAR